MQFTGNRYIVAGEPETIVKKDIHVSATTTALEDKKPSLKDRSTTTTDKEHGKEEEQGRPSNTIQAPHDTTQPDRAHMDEDRPLDPLNTSPASNVSSALQTVPPATTTTTASPRKVPRPRYCKACKGFKPPRSHHCRVCKRCILKMDHHCPWINNCVGHYNYGHFLRFVTWVTITTGACMALLLLRVWDAMQYERFYLFNPDLAPTKTQIAFLAINVFVDGGVLLAVGTLCGYHLWSLVNNTSTIEVWEIEKVNKMIKAGKMRKTKFPYDLGCRRNYRQVLGPNAWMWLWPQPMLGNGLEYEVIDDKDAALLWPPREYQASKRQDNEYVSQYSTTYRRHIRRRPRPRPRYVDGEDDEVDQRTTTVATTATPPPPPPPRHYSPHVRRGSEGWIVQDLTIQERAALYDMQYAYELQHPDYQHEGQAYPSPVEDDDDGDYHEGFSDHEHEDAFGQPTYYDDEGEEEDEEEYTDDEEDDDEDEDVSEYDDDYFDERNPYLEYDEEPDEDDTEEEEEDDDEKTHVEVNSQLRRREFTTYPSSNTSRRKRTPSSTSGKATGRSRAMAPDSAHDAFAEDMDEVTLMGRDRHMIGKFFSNGMPTIQPEDLTTTDDDGEDYQGEIDEWDEGEGLATGCVPSRPVVAAAVSSEGDDAVEQQSQKFGKPVPQKTLYEQIAERQEAMKKKKKKKKKNSK
ncbi:Palmitoyltransferase [Actinomortierella wolfii]|nr:Palmitoyltransferase [Actinomortierella wolfii]